MRKPDPAQVTRVTFVAIVAPMLLTAQPFIAVTARYSETAEPPREAGFTQSPTGIWFRSEALPAAIELPADALGAIPPPRLWTRMGRLTPIPPHQAGSICYANAHCEDWFGRSLERRQLLGRLVSRRFELRESHYVETRAEAAYRALQNARAAEAHRQAKEEQRSSGRRSESVSRVFLNSDAALRPPGTIAVHESAAGAGIHIPWNALPPRGRLDLDRVTVRIVYGPQRSVTYRVRLARLRQYRYTPCDLPPLAAIERYNNPYVDPQPGFFIPQQDTLLDVIHAWEDVVHVQDPKPTGPLLYTQKASVLRLGDDEWLCGPILKYRRGAAETAIRPLGLEPEEIRLVAANASGFDVARQPEGSLLILSRVRHHSRTLDTTGPGGAAPALSWEVLHLPPLPPEPGVYFDRIRSVASRRSLRLTWDSVHDPRAYGVRFSEDLRTITENWASGVPFQLNSDWTWKTRQLRWDGRRFREGPWRPTTGPRRPPDGFPW